MKRSNLTITNLIITGFAVLSHNHFTERGTQFIKII